MIKEKRIKEDKLTAKRKADILQTAKDVLEEKVDGIAIIMKVTKVPNGIQIDGVSRVHNVERSMQLRAIIGALHIDPVEMLASSILRN